MQSTVTNKDERKKLPKIQQKGEEREWEEEEGQV